MWTSILKQMWNQKRSNSWIALELLLVFCLTWYLVDYLFVLAYNYNIPNHRDVEHTLQVNISEFDVNHSQYDAAANEPEALEANYARILQTLRNYPGVESIGISFDGSTPGGGSYYGHGFHNAMDTTRTVNGQGITIDPENDYFKVFRFSTENGRKMISTRDFEWVPNGIILSRSVARALFGEEPAFGREVARGRPLQKQVVIGVVDDNKRFDHLRPQHYFYFPLRLNARNLKNAEISVRYQTSLPDTKFREQFKTELSNTLQIGNFYLLSIIPYREIGQMTNQNMGVDNNIRIRVFLMTFFLLCVFLCAMGAFWYRISLRPNEIGLRKALGASRMRVHASLIIEGFWLLLLITLPAMLIEYQFVHAGLIETIGRTRTPDPAYLPDRTFVRFLITNILTFFFIGTVIILAIWLPAQKGASLTPADALHYE
jgi:hypothetical protein